MKAVQMLEKAEGCFFNSDSRKTISQLLLTNYKQKIKSKIKSQKLLTSLRLRVIL